MTEIKQITTIDELIVYLKDDKICNRCPFLRYTTGKFLGMCGHRSSNDMPLMMEASKEKTELGFFKINRPENCPLTKGGVIFEKIKEYAELGSDI